MRRPELTIKQILIWTDDFYASAKRWPKRSDGRIAGSLGETWQAVQMALINNGRGLSIRSSLAQLLQEKRGVRNRSNLPRFSVKKILAWADDHYAKTVAWPNSSSGPVLAARSEKWSQIDKALRGGYRGCRPGGSLAQLLSSHRKVRRNYHVPPITTLQILRWATAYHRRHGTWPTRNSGPIPEATGETWARINVTLVQGNRGFPKGSSLAKLLAKYGKQRNHKGLPKLRIRSILHWADQYIRKTGQWPTHLSGPIPGSKGETWSAVHSALYQGGRGFPGGISLYQVLNKYRDKPFKVR